MMSVGEETRNLTSPPEFCGGAEPRVSHLEATLSVVFISKEKKGIQKEREKPMEREEIVICHRSPLCFFVERGATTQHVCCCCAYILVGYLSAG